MSERILRAGEALTHHASKTDLLVAKLQLQAAFRSSECKDHERTAEHLCSAIEAIVIELRSAGIIS